MNEWMSEWINKIKWKNIDQVFILFDPLFFVYNRV